MNMSKRILLALPRIFLTLVLCLSVASFTFSQEKLLSGTVTDGETGEPLIGVSIAVVGFEGKGAITDFDGNYALAIPEGATQLKFSYVGYEEQILDIVEGVLNVQMSSGEMLDEVVVIGYGTQKQKEITSAITQVDQEDFNQGNIQNPMQLLQGKVAGLSITKAGADPNGGFDVRLRGLNTFGNSNPLVVVDGVFDVPLETVDPNDVAEFSVLKDASATSIYGARGSNGVIIIKTKSGQGEFRQISYNGAVTVENLDRVVDVLSAEEYLSFAEVGRAVEDFGSQTDWFDEITRTAITHVHNLSMSGGNSNSNYRFSINYRDGQGVALNNGYDQLNGRLTYTQKALREKLVLTGTLVATVRNETYFPSEAFGFATRYNPTAPVRADDDLSSEWGGYFQRDAFGFFNPVAASEQSDLSGRKNRLLGSAKAEYEFLPGLFGSVSYTIAKDVDNFDSYWSKEAFWTPFGTKTGKGWASKTSNESTYELFQGLVRYANNFGRLDFEGMVGYNWEQNTDQGFSASNAGFITDDFNTNNIGSGDDLVNGEANMSSFRSQDRLIGFFTRFKFNYDDTYFVTINARREGSSKFGSNNRWGNFFGVSGGLTLTNLVTIPGVDRVKARVGWGQTGNVPLNDFDYLLTYGVNPGGRFFLNGEYVQALRPVRNPNPDLGWETKREINAGLDLNFFDYKMGLTIDYFNVNVSDLILNSQVRVPPNLAPNKVLNVGEMQNSGLEFALSYDGISSGKFSYSPSIVFTKYFDTEIVKITSEETTGSGEIVLGDLGAPFLVGINTVRVTEGSSLGGLVGPRYNGLDENGNITLVDEDGDGVADEFVLGNGLPQFQIGFNNTFSFGNFDFNFFLRGIFGHDLLNVNNAKYGAPASIAIQNGTKQALDFIDATNGPVYSDQHVESANFVKLDNATLGYTFDLNSGTINSLRVFVNGQNLFVITDYSGVDPEPRLNDFGNPLAPGIDRENTYFTTRAFTFGVNLSF